MKLNRKLKNAIIIVLIIIIAIVGYKEIKTINLITQNESINKDSIQNLSQTTKDIQGKVNSLFEYDTIAAIQNLNLTTKDIQGKINSIFGDDEKAAVAFNNAFKAKKDMKDTYYLYAIYHNPNKLNYWTTYYDFLKQDNIQTYFNQLIRLIDEAIYQIDVENIQNLTDLRKEINSYINIQFTNDEYNSEKTAEQEKLQASYDIIYEKIVNMTNDEFVFDNLDDYMVSLGLLTLLDSYTDTTSVKDLIMDLTYSKNVLDLLNQQNNLASQILIDKYDNEKTIKQAELYLDYINQLQISIMANYGKFNKCKTENLNQLTKYRLDNNNNFTKCFDQYKKAKSSQILEKIKAEDSNVELLQKNYSSNYTDKLNATSDYIIILSGFLNEPITVACSALINEKIDMQSVKINEYTRQRSLAYQRWAASVINNSNSSFEQSLIGKNESISTLLYTISSKGFFIIDQRLLITQVNTLYVDFLDKLNSQYAKEKQSIDNTIENNLENLKEMEDF